MKGAKLILLLLLIHCPVLAEENAGKQLFDQFNEWLRHRYRDVKLIEKFGFINMYVKAREEDHRIGLSDEELTSFLKLRYKNNFANVPYKKTNRNISEEDKKKIGTLWCAVWTVGKNYPIAYHVECRMGTYSNDRIFGDATLGFGSKENVPDSIREAVDRMVSGFAILFFKYRGEL